MLNLEQRNALVEKHLPFLCFIARGIHRSLPASVQYEDLIQAGAIGLIEAASRYDPEQGPFQTFAKIRVRGAILDSLRALDYLSRDMRRKVKTEEKLALQEERLIPIHFSLMSLDACHDIEIQEIINGPGGPEFMLQESERVRVLTNTIETLPPRLAKVLKLKYQYGESCKKIAHKLGINESRVCQLQKQARAYLGDELRKIRIKGLEAI